MIHTEAQGNEIITLSFGSYSNFVSVHLWNTLQHELDAAEINSNVFFHCTQQSATPRALLFDTKGAFENAAIAQAINKNEENNIGTWGGSSSVINVEGGAQSPFSKLLGQVPFHDKSLCELDQFRYSVNDSFDLFSAGHAVLEGQSYEGDEILDRFRYFSEECDSLQGIQCFVDVDSGFGGFTSDFLRNIREDYPKAPIITYGLTPHDNRVYMDKTFLERRAINSGLCLQTLSDASSLYIPLSSQAWSSALFPHMNLTVSNPYHTSLIFAAAIDTLMLPVRLTPNQVTLPQYVQTHKMSSHMNVCSLSCSLPFPVTPTETNMFDAFGPLNISKGMTSLTPLLQREVQLTPVAETAVVRGISYSKQDIISDDFAKYIYTSYPCLSRIVSPVIKRPLRSHLPFSHSSPVIVSRATPIVAGNGDIQIHIDSDIPILSHLQTTKAVHPLLKSIVEEFSQYKQPYYNTYETKDDFREVEYELQTIEDQYDRD